MASHQCRHTVTSLIGAVISSLVFYLTHNAYISFPTVGPFGCMINNGYDVYDVCDVYDVYDVYDEVLVYAPT